jgi:hypothetical protein
MTVRRNRMRAAMLALLTLLVLALGCGGVALAAEPALVIAHPTPGSSTNAQTPAFSGTSNDPVDPITLVIYAGASATGTPVQEQTLLTPTEISPQEASWEIVPVTPLAQGQYTALVEQTNTALETGESGPVTFTIDTTPPAVTISAVGSPTKEATPTLTGDAGLAAGDLPTVTVTVYEGATASGTVVASANVSGASGTWSYQTPHLADGTYTAQATQRDEAGNVGTSAAVTFRVDTTPPVVTLDAVATPTKISEPTFAGDAGTAVGDVASVTVKIHEGSSLSGKLLASKTVTPNHGEWSYKSAHLSDGTYTVQASQSDEAGNLGVSAAVTFRVDTTPPVVTLDPVASLSNDAEPTLAGSAGQLLGDEQQVTVTVYEGSSVAGKELLSEVAPASAGSWSHKLTRLADGTYTAQASQSDEAGNVGTSQPVTFTIDTKPPAVSIEPVPTPSKDAEPTLGGAAGNEPGDHQSVTVTVYEGESTAGNVVESKSVTALEGKWSYKTAHLSDGTYTAQAFQTDEAGNIGTTAAVTFRVDTTPPVVSIDALASPTRDAEPTLAGGAGSALGDEPTVTVTIYAGNSTAGKVIVSQAVPQAGGAWSYKAPHLADGQYTAQASQSDEAGNVGTSSTTTFTVDTTAPKVTLTSPQDGVVLDGSRPTFSGGAGHEPGDEPSITLRIYKGSSVSGSPIASVEHLKPEADNHWSTGANGPALPNGEYTAVAEQYDDAGNLGTSTPVTFEIETEVTLDTSRFVQRASGFFTGPTPSFDGTGGTAPEDEAVIVRIYEGEASSGTPLVRLEAPVSAGGSWEVGPVPTLQDGSYTVQAEQQDSGVKHQVEATFTVDASSPQPAITAPANGSSTPSSSQLVEGLAGDAEGDLPTVTVHLYAGPTNAGTLLQTSAAQAANGAWSVTFGGLSPGTYTIQAEQSDDVGNVGYSSPVTFTYTAPFSPPAPPPPLASFRWVPATPHPGETVTLISTSSDVSSPITSYAWAPAGNGAFTTGESVLTTSFATAGVHVVQLRVSDANGLTSTVANTIQVAAAAPTLLEPFPIVRMAGSYDAAGAKISLLTVQAPVGATIKVKCHGAGCPAKSETVVVASGAKSKPGTVLVTLRRFERPLRAGTVLEIEVSYHGEIGKFTRFVIHHGKSPSRQDLCLNPAATTPIQCPS